MNTLKQLDKRWKRFEAQDIIRKAGREIVNVRDCGCDGYRATLRTPGQPDKELRGSWCFGPSLSWYEAESKAWVSLGGYWQ